MYVGSLPTPEVRFVDVPVRSPHDSTRIGDEVIDWWPTQTMQERRMWLTQLAAYGAQWVTKKGTLHTAELLFQSRHNPEAVAAVLIGASLWDKEKELREEWRGRIARLIHSVQAVIHEQFSTLELPFWHHASRTALPCTIIQGEFARALQPVNFEDLIHIAIIESRLALSLWTLVRVFHEPKGLSVVK